MLHLLALFLACADKPSGTDSGCVAATWYRDADGDSYGSGEGETACTAPDGYSAVGGDCDDTPRPPQVDAAT